MLTNMHATSGMLIRSIRSDCVDILIFVHTFNVKYELLCNLSVYSH